MKCPIDQTEMEKGYLNMGTMWASGDHAGSSSKILQGLSGGSYVSAWKCPKCGKVELKVEEEKK